MVLPARPSRVSRHPLRHPNHSFVGLAVCLLAWMCLPAAGFGALGDLPGDGPPRPPAMGPRDLIAAPHLAFQVQTSQKDSAALQLSAGWNLVSLPLEPYDTAVASVLAPIAASVDQVWVYEGCDASDPWRLYDPTDPVASNLTALDHRLGFWIRLHDDAVLTLDGDPPVDTTTPICSGWNLIGHPRNGSLPVAGALVSIAASVDRVFGFEGGVGNDGWSFWSPNTPDWVNDLVQLVPGRGYWVLANADATFVAVDPEPPPVLGALDLLEGQEITAPTTITATLESNAELAWNLAHRPEGSNQWTVFAEGTGTAVSAELDPTLLLNGIYEIRLQATDVFGQSTSAEGNVMVAGAMKPGVVTLSFADMTVPMAGLPITVVRTYDSRDKSVGDFGVGWRLELVKGTYRNNRPPGEGWILTGSTNTFPQIPCDRSVETLGHFTDVRLDDQRAYRFALVVDTFGTASLFNGGCEGEARFIQTGGRSGASLDILGNRDIFHTGQNEFLVDATTQELFEPQTVLLTTPEGLEYVLTLEGGVQQISDPTGQTVLFDDNGIHHSDGRSVFFQRDAEGRIRYLIDPMGQTVSYTYDEAGDLVAVTDLLDDTLRFEYHPTIPHHLERILGADGEVAQEFLYDDEGRMAFTCSADGSCVETEHDVASQTETIYDATGRATGLTYDDWGNVVATTDAAGQSSAYTYDAGGRVTSFTDALGNVTTYGYDERGNMTSVTEPHAPGEPASEHTVVQTFDSRNRVTAIDLPSGGGYRFAYGSATDAMQITDHEGNVLATYGYDLGGRLISEGGPFGTDQYVIDAFGNAVQHTDVFGRDTSLTYDALNRVTSMTDSDGLAASFGYDPKGRRTRADFGNGVAVDMAYSVASGDFWEQASGPTVGSVARQYDDRGQLTGVQMASGGSLDFNHDPSGRLLEQVGSDGNVTTFEYDSAGRLMGKTDPRGAVIQLQRDALGRIVGRTDPFGHTEQRTYAPDGRLSSRTDALGRTWTYDVAPLEIVNTDPLGRQTRIALSPLGLPQTWTYADGSQRSMEYLLTSALVGADEYPTRLVDEAGRERQITYDTFGRLVGARDDSGAETTFAYAHDLLASITGPTGVVRSYTYDERDNPATVTFEDGGLQRFGYDEHNRMSWKVRPSGTTWSYDYDDAGRETGRQADDGLFVERQWDLNDRIVSLQDPTGTTLYGYDTAGDLSSITFPDGSSVSYGRDLLGRATSVTVAAPSVSPMTTVYAYNAVGNLATVTDPLGGITTWTYDDADRPIERQLPNGVTTQWTYDLRDRVLSVTHRNGAGIVLAAATYERAVSGEPTRITHGDGSWVDLAYDGGLRLTSESHYEAGGQLQETLTYTYDGAGNRTTRSSSAGLDSYAYGPGYRLSGVSGANSENYGYDADGRVTSIGRDGVTRDLTYDAADRLTSVSEGGQQLASYSHDGAGRRVAASGPDGERRFLMAPSVGEGLESPHLVTNGAGAMAAAYVWGGLEPLMRLGPEGPTYYLTDAMGSVIGLADGAGQSAARFRYDAFGNMRSASGPSSDAPIALGGDLRFHGAWLEEATGLYHFRAREYDPVTGRFLSQDPIDGNLERPETLHPYLFVEGNPHLYSDPTGLFTLIEINIGIQRQGAANLVNTALANYLRHFAREKVGDIVSSLLLDFVSKMLPWNGQIAAVNNARNRGAQGIFFGDNGAEMMCMAFGGDLAFEDFLRLEVQVAPRSGKPHTDGLACPPTNQRFGRTLPRPDFLISEYPPTELRRGHQKSWLIGDFKIGTRNINVRKRQFASIMNHARNYEYLPIAMYITWQNNSERNLLRVMNHGLRQGIILYIMVLKG